MFNIPNSTGIVVRIQVLPNVWIIVIQYRYEEYEDIVNRAIKRKSLLQRCFNGLRHGTYAIKIISVENEFQE